MIIFAYNTNEEPRGTIVAFYPDDIWKNYGETIILTIRIKDEGGNGTLWYKISLITDSTIFLITEREEFFMENQTKSYTITHSMVYNHDITLIATVGHGSKQDDSKVIQIHYTSEMPGGEGEKGKLILILNKFIIFTSAVMIILIFVDFLIKKLKRR
ncbi:hypothetical protein J7L60_00395 [Candidatus Bathyarchaeota archaeon]|nr:hypothetical protein [Candidatus Bathyarchaeota archaeon]